MSRHGDYSDDMGPVLLDDATTEALLRGEPTAPDEELAGVSAFLGEMRASAASQPPPPPSPALAAMLRRGTQPQALGDAAAVPASPRRESLLRRWQGRIAVSALGLAVGVTGMVGAGAAGLLPGPAERFVAGLVETLTPLRLPADGQGATDRRGDGQPTPAAGQGGPATTVSGGGVLGPDGGPASTAGPGSGPRPGGTTGTGNAPGGGGAPTPDPPAQGPSSGPGPAGRPGSGITAPTVTTPTTPTIGRLPTTPTTTAPTPPSVTPPTIPRVSTTLPVTLPTAPRALP